MSNSFSAVDIHLPEKYQEYFYQYCLTRTEGSRNDPEESPFPRMVDMWFLALCFAVKEKLEPVFEKEGRSYKAIEGTVFGSDTWRSNALILIAIAYTEDIEVVSDPHKMMRIANAYALAGLPRLIALLEQREGDTALDYLSDEIDQMINM